MSKIQFEKIWGPFFQKFDGFSKFFENLTVFSGSTMKQSSAQAKNLITPFLRALFHFRLSTPKKQKFGDNIWSDVRLVKRVDYYDSFINSILAKYGYLRKFCHYIAQD